MKPYPAYLFDLDGTLIDSAPDIHNALNHTLVANGLSPVDEALTRLWVGHGSRALLASALVDDPATELTEPSQAMVDEFQRYYGEHIADHSQPYPGVIDALDALKSRGAKLAVVTNKYVGLSAKVLAELDLARRFDALIGNETAANPKPAADPAEFAASELGVDVKDCLFVGDAPPDVGCARAAGCDVVVVSYGYNQGVDPAELGGDAVIDSLTALL